MRLHPRNSKFLVRQKVQYLMLPSEVCIGFEVGENETSVEKVGKLTGKIFTLEGRSVASTLMLGVRLGTLTEVEEAIDCVVV